MLSHERQNHAYQDPNKCAQPQVQLHWSCDTAQTNPWAPHSCSDRNTTSGIWPHAHDHTPRCLFWMRGFLRCMHPALSLQHGFWRTFEGKRSFSESPLLQKTRTSNNKHVCMHGKISWPAEVRTVHALVAGYELRRRHSSALRFSSQSHFRCS